MDKKKLKIYQEDAKLRQTTHWDLDYMTTAQIDALYSVKRSQKTHNSATSTSDNGVYSHPIRQVDPQCSRQQSQESLGTSVIAALLRPFKGFANLLRDKVRVYSLDR